MGGGTFPEKLREMSAGLKTRQVLVGLGALLGSAAASADATTTPATTATTVETPCVMALPRVEAQGRATVQSRCGSKAETVHDGDRIALGEHGHLRLQADIDDRRSIDVICVNAGAPLALTVAGNEPPWVVADDDGGVTCGGWVDNERVCRGAGGDEVLVCDAVARLKPLTSARAERPLGLPTWYVGELPVVVDVADAAPVVADAKAVERSARRFTRVAVYQVKQIGLDDRLAVMMTASLTAELRKLTRTSVVGLDEVNTMLALEVEKQVTGCPDESCLAEIAEALGVDVLVTADIAAVGDERFVSVKRIDQREARVTGQISQRLTGAGGEEFLAVVGPAVEALFPEMPLKPGASRGVAPQLALRLNPPPLDPFVFWSGVSLTGASVVGTGVAGVVLFTTFRDFDALRSGASAPGAELKTLQANTTQWSNAVLVGGGVSAGLAVATGVSALFVDWHGYRDDLQLETVE